MPAARQAVSDDFARRGVAMSATRTVLTASTSEAYSLLFKLLCDPGDVVLAPRPSYPLVEHLTELEGVSLEHYSVEFHGEWIIDVHGLEARLAAPARPRIRAIIIVSPNNPTGSVLKTAELNAIAPLARQYDVALIADEVFTDYAMNGSPCPSVLSQDAALTFSLGGLSKSVGLPQLKLAWIGVGGPAAMVDDAMDRLETICDAYLSVSTPVQLALRDLLSVGAQVRAQIQHRVGENFAELRGIGATQPACSVLPVEAGWYAVIQVPAIHGEEAIVLQLLERTGILVNPGYFFDFEREAFLVISLLPEPQLFASAVRMLFEQIGPRR
jgi:aspartate/methionine/tyrosine aminotransferase